MSALKRLVEGELTYTVQIPHVDFVRFQLFERSHQILAKPLRSVFQVVVPCRRHRLSSRREILCLHDKSSLLPVEFAKHSLGGTFAVRSGSIDFVVTMGLEDVEDLTSSLEIMNSGLLSPFFAEGHCTEYNIDIGFLS
jgi:hypothetical protein